MTPTQKMRKIVLTANAGVCVLAMSLTKLPSWHCVAIGYAAAVASALVSTAY